MQLKILLVLALPVIIVAMWIFNNTVSNLDSLPPPLGVLDTTIKPITQDAIKIITPSPSLAQILQEADFINDADGAL